MSSNNYVNLSVRANPDGSRSYYQHDDRDRRGGGGGGGHRSRNRKWGKGQRRGPQPIRGEGAQFVDKDGDVNMSSEESAGDRRNRFAPYAVSKGKAAHSKGNRQWSGNNEYRGGANKQHGASQSSDAIWSKVLIPYGRKLSKDFLLHTIMQACQVPFIPLNYQYDGNSVVFFVDNKTAASSIAKLNRQLSSPEGPKIAIIVRPSPPPTIALTNDVIDVIKGCVNRRFTTASNILDLSFFHLDPALKKEGLFLPLIRPNIMSVVVKTISETASNLQVLDITGNKLTSLDLLSNLLKKLSGLRILLLAQNQISRPSELDKIRDLPLEELTLTGNPLCSIYKDHSDYVDVVRKRFPKLNKLDGSVLPMQISFEVEKVVSLPSSQGSFFVNEEARGVVITFLEQYFALFDSADRQGLIEAYHDEALFSMSALKPSQRGVNMSDYVHCSRNLLKVPDSDRRSKLLNTGKMQIIHALKRLPRTQHDPSSFSVDVGLVSPTILAFSICGVFKEIDNKMNDYPIRAFSRAFVLVPQGAGFSIVNELLLITAPTTEQTKAAFKTPAPTPSPSPILMPATDDALRQQMVTSFSQQSGMNMDWSVKCLQDNDWDYDKAAHIFTELNAQGRIPPEAFRT